MRNDDRMIAADSSIVSGEGVWKGGRRGSEDRKLLGEPKLPPKLVRAIFLLLLRACCFCCSALPGLPWLTGCSPERGANSKRISLDADAALINQFRRCLEAVLLFSAWSLGRTPRGNSSPKESVSCASVPCCFCCSGVVTSCSYCVGHCLLLLLCQR